MTQKYSGKMLESGILVESSGIAMEIFRKTIQSLKQQDK